MTASIRSSHVTELGDSRPLASPDASRLPRGSPAALIQPCLNVFTLPAILCLLPRLLAAPGVASSTCGSLFLTLCLHALRNIERLCSALSTCRASSCECVTGCCSITTVCSCWLCNHVCRLQRPPAHFVLARLLALCARCLVVILKSYRSAVYTRRCHPRLNPGQMPRSSGHPSCNTGATPKNGFTFSTLGAVSMCFTGYRSEHIQQVSG
jgi:hypothetical protein